MKFTKGEFEVMQILWERGELKPGGIRREFPRAIKDSALRSYLRILVEKGHVSRRLQGKAYYYKARTPRQSAFQRMFREMVDVFCGGSPEALVAHMVENEQLTEDELGRLRKIVDGAQPRETRTREKQPSKSR